MNNRKLSNLTFALFLSGAIATLAVSASAQMVTPKNPGDGLARQAASGRAPSPEQQAMNDANTNELMREMKLARVNELRTPLNATRPDLPDFANYDEAKANPYPLPDVMTLNSGKPVKTLADWRKRRQEIFSYFDEYVYGKVPKNVPKVNWKKTDTVNETIQGVSVITKHYIGHVDNSSYPAITVDIYMNVSTPASMKSHKVPVIMQSGSIAPRPAVAGRGVLPGAAAGRGAPQGPIYPNPQKLILERGWGLVNIDTGNVQPDNGANLVKGIVGLVNKGQPRKMDDWGVLRAVAWAYSRGMDQLTKDPDVNAKEVAVAGHSRGAKAALVALVYDSRFASGYISSSGAGGANLYRRNYGEAVSNLVAPNEFHWFAGNFIKYGAVGHSANDMAMDSNEFIALIAPRPVFFSGGRLIMDPGKIPGDAWEDAEGTFMAAASASPAWKMYGKVGLGSMNFPPMLTPDVDGYVGFRQHDQGHPMAPNWETYINFVAKYFN